MSDIDSEPAIPSRRLKAKTHLANAAKSSMGSNEERYSLVAAQSGGATRYRRAACRHPHCSQSCSLGGSR